jgi:urease subunit gamma/beta
MPPMRLTAFEEERLLIYSAAELARRHRDRGLKLNHPEAIALICDAVLEAARAGASYAEAEAAGRTAVAPDDLMPGVADLLDEIRVEALFDDGTRLVVLVEPVDTGPGSGPAGATVPGAIVRSQRRPDPTAGLEKRTLRVQNDSRRVVRVSSHYPFERVNPRLAFDRDQAVGFRLDLPAGATERWAPGESKEVRLVRYARSPGDGA